MMSGRLGRLGIFLVWNLCCTVVFWNYDSDYEQVVGNPLIESKSVALRV